jgi:AraC-like DNA-binding protein
MPPGEKLLRKMKGWPVYWQQWVLQALEELRVESATNGILQWELFFTSLAAGLDTATDLVLWKKVERFTRVKSQVLREWFKLRQTPTLEDILKFCYVCKVTPLQVMRGEVFPLVEAIEHGTPYRRSRHPLHHAARPCVDRERCRQMLQLVLDGHEKPLSLRQLAERFGYAEQTLRRYFPQECALVSRRAREYRTEQRKQRVAQLCEEVRQAVITLYNQGVFPSHLQVKMTLSSPGMLRIPEAAAALHAVRCELGLER